MTLKADPEKVTSALAHYAVPGGISLLGLYGLEYVDEVSMFDSFPVFLLHISAFIFVFGGIALMLWLFGSHFKQMKDWLLEKYASKEEKWKAYAWLALSILCLPTLAVFIIILGLLKAVLPS